LFFKFLFCEFKRLPLQQSVAILLYSTTRLSIALLVASRVCLSGAHVTNRVFRKMSTRINVAGLKSCGHFELAKTASLGLSAICPDKYSVDIQEFPSKEEYSSALAAIKDRLRAPEHTESPIVWLDDNAYVGGAPQLIDWGRRILGQAPLKPPAMQPDNYDPGHAYTYDLLVIGGGSGGLACSKAAVKLGAKVGVMDFVKPSPQGTTWGLGGTCVNVGCIPKKLMHTAALYGEFSHEAEAYGWKRSGSEAPHSWQTLMENVGDHIKSLNFGYRVQLREEGVSYVNKLGRLLDAHTIETTDKKGKKDTITAARIVVSVGGRPTPLECPGGDLAISSDDLFSLDHAPGRTCVVGAGYVAMECAGFINGLKQGDVTVLVRSIPLRGFDRFVVSASVVRYERICDSCIHICFYFCTT
jgi:thioredoxin reductase